MLAMTGKWPTRIERKTIASPTTEIVTVPSCYMSTVTPAGFSSDGPSIEIVVRIRARMLRSTVAAERRTGEHMIHDAI